MIIGRPFGYDKKEKDKLIEIIKDQTTDYDFPILFGVDIGHTDPMITIPLGIKVIIDSKSNTFEFVEKELSKINMRNLKRWDDEFKRDYPVENFQEIKHYWWVDCYKEIESFVLREIKLNKNYKILEAGSGSGNSSLLLANLVGQVFLLDKSPYSLECSKRLANYYKLKNVNIINGDIFNIPFNEQYFDLCWNVGVIEHFTFEESLRCVEEMIRVTKNNGYVCIGVPNFQSLPIIKAKINSLLSRFINIKGYKLDDEKRYTKKI